MNLQAALNKLKASEKWPSLEELKALHDEMLKHVLSIGPSHYPELLVDPLLNQLHDEVMKQTWALAEQETLRQAIGVRPKKICWVLFGSGARMEQTICTDQDNGVLYECLPSEKEACLTFIKTAAELGTYYLNEIGYPFCPGNVMATNKRWSNDTDSWLEAMARHIKRGQPDDIKYLFIASDIRGFYGDLSLAQETKSRLIQTLQASPFILKRMHEHIREPKVSLGWFGHVYTERFGKQSGKVNIKVGFYVPIVNALKFLAIKHGIFAPSSLDRLEALEHLGVIVKEEAVILKQALQICLYFRGLASLNPSSQERDYLDLTTLSESDVERLKASLKEIKAFHSHVIRKGGSL
ncbi:DUF294 nucleotidyltransferase-like domain-containing protein [Pullulanibacillus sp. KACC 23026]|uniref:DUF294 nucleotidyltransferase-like domain-containing protein n=1 Tax=Pullulanibacillus sp. KACC 23026 TaxID=3028315 RepID=UPI0023B01410|nr:DUF294 nucleotidyltransferase-like domain-containing protein [Pullulanibacillus sp. KACC 23026]WEG11795.1 DUF294 nucleotidyltransferase-like domain-containing protein [Pullulanibacillus sp. KACC 23026]